jgi:ribosomal protein S25
MKYEISVHKYKYSQSSRRNILKKLSNQGFINYIGQNKTHYYYTITSEVGMTEYRKRK